MKVPPQRVARAEVTPLDPYGGVARRPGYELTKRAIDIFLAATCLILFSPLWVMLGAFIRLTSPGPALFRGTVVGFRGQLFTYYKFRTMRAGDDSHHKRWLHDFVTADAAYDGRQFKVTMDPRITPVGRWLRRLSVDEIPQLINVLRGEMSVVGPRPPIPYEFELYDQPAKRRLAVRPGITGLYQVTARSKVPFSRMLAIDLDYVERRSVRLDCEIMIRTLAVMLLGRGAA